MESRGFARLLIDGLSAFYSTLPFPLCSWNWWPLLTSNRGRTRQGMFLSRQNSPSADTASGKLGLSQKAHGQHAESGAALHVSFTPPCVRPVPSGTRSTVTVAMPLLVEFALATLRIGFLRTFGALAGPVASPPVRLSGIGVVGSSQSPTHVCACAMASTAVLCKIFLSKAFR
jgi:hypothetical protein